MDLDQLLAQLRSHAAAHVLAVRETVAEARPPLDSPDAQRVLTELSVLLVRVAHADPPPVTPAGRRARD